MARKWNGTDATYVKGLTVLEKRLEKLLQQYKKSTDKRRASLPTTVGAYTTEQELQDAFGYGDITDDEYHALLAEMRDKEDLLNDLYPEDAAAFFLSAVLRDLRYERDDLVAEMKQKGATK